MDKDADAEISLRVSESIVRLYDSSVNMVTLVAATEEGLKRFLAIGEVMMQASASGTIAETPHQSFRELCAMIRHSLTNDHVLYNQLALGLWSILEATIEDLVLIVMENRPDRTDLTDFKRINVPLADVLQLRGREKAHFVLRQLSTNSPSGLPQFEKILSAVGAPAELYTPVRRRLLEFYAIRNVIAHRGGVMDEQAKAAMPWKDVRVGESVRLTRAELQHFSDCTVGFACASANKILGSSSRGLVAKNPSLRRAVIAEKMLRLQR